MTLPVKQEFQWQQLVVVVNGNKNVKENTRKKVLEVIDRLDYRPNAVVVVWQAKEQQLLVL